MESDMEGKCFLRRAKEMVNVGETTAPSGISILQSSMYRIWICVLPRTDNNSAF